MNLLEKHSVKIDEIRTIYPNIEIIDFYNIENKKGKKYLHSTFYCSQCNDTIENIMYDNLKKRGCTICNKSKSKHKDTSIEHKQEIVTKINKNVVVLNQWRGEIKVKGKIKTTSFVKLYCIEHDKTWDARWTNVRNQSFMCGECANHVILTLNEKSNKYPNFEFLEEIKRYEKSNLLKIRCKECNHVWNKSWDKFKHKPMCPNCGYEKRRMTEEEINKKLWSKNKTLSVINYSPRTAHENFEFICSECGEITTCTWANMSQRYYCQTCRALESKKYSSGEKYIRGLLDELNIKYILQHKFDDCVYKKILKFDFYFPEINTCLEYDGKQHFEPVKYFGGEETFEKIKIRDKTKNEYCIKNSISMIRIPYYASKSDIIKVITVIDDSIKDIYEKTQLHINNWK